MNASLRRRGPAITTRAAFVVGAILSCMVAAPAMAQDSMTFHVSGTLEKACSIDVPGDQQINPASSEPQQIGTLVYRCNFAGNSTLRLWSDHGGNIVSPASTANANQAQVLPYAMTFDNNLVGQLTGNGQSATPIVRGIATPGRDQNAPVTLRMVRPATVAGTYSDTIYVSISP